MNGIHQNGKATFTAGAAIAKGDFVKFSSGKVVKCAAATDIAIGVALDGAEAGELVPVQLLTSGDTVLVKAGSIALANEKPLKRESALAGTQPQKTCTPNLVSLANERMAKNPGMTYTTAFALVMKEHPEVK